MSRPADHPAPTWTFTDADAPVSDDAIRVIAALLLESVNEEEKRASTEAGHQRKKPTCQG